MTADDDHRISRLPPQAQRGHHVHRDSVPQGKLEMVVTYLEMHAPPKRPPAHLGSRLALMHAERCNVSYYRYLYETVGARWMWFERRTLDDAALAAIIQDPKVEIHVLHVAGVPAGFAELDLREENEIELAFFGLIPEYIGRGLGRHLLDWVVDEAWMKRPDRFWVHTCNFDHPAAIAVYQRAGFVPYDQETVVIDDPRLPGAMPAGREFR